MFDKDGTLFFFFCFVTKSGQDNLELSKAYLHVYKCGVLKLINSLESSFCTETGHLT